MKFLFSFLFTLTLSTFNFSYAFAEWRDIPSSELPTPDKCDYRVIVNSVSPNGIESYYYNLSSFITQPYEYNGPRVNVTMSYHSEDRNKFALANLIPKADLARFESQINDRRYDVDCSIYMFGGYPVGEKRKRDSSVAGFEYTIGCWSLAYADTTPFNFGNTFRLTGVPIRLQKNC